ncbi:MAG: inositol monophosphatase family protein [Anaerolineae bacterium]
MSEYLQFARELALAGGDVLRRRYEGDFAISSKSTAVDLVTEVDHECEALLLGRIRERYPDHNIYAEETASDAAVLRSTTPVWLVDPLDGTVNYAHGVPVFSVSIALVVAGRPVVGAVMDPMRQELFSAERGAGAWANERRLRVSGASALAQSLLATGFPYSRATERDNNLTEFNALVTRTQGVRRAGSAALDLSWTAAGRFDGYWEMYLSPWDWAAGWLLVEEAGGRVSNVAGEDWSIDQSPSRIVASNGLIHEELLGVLGAARRELARAQA